MFLQTSKRFAVMSMALAAALLSACAQSPVGAGAQAYAVPGGSQNCVDCGTVTNVAVVERKPQSSGAGMVIGALIGAAAGREVSNDEDDDQGMAAGAVAGAAAGHEVERRSGQWYQVTVAMDNGRTEYIYQKQAPQYGVGARVRVTNTQ